jgi:hypothetical protein
MKSSISRSADRTEAVFRELEAQHTGVDRTRPT